MEKGDPEVYRAVGSVAGAILPLLYVRPVNIRDALARFVFAVICGYAFYFVALDVFGWPETSNRILAGAIIAAAASWFLAGAIIIRWIKSASKDD
jgi:hypothetical protein